MLYIKVCANVDWNFGQAILIIHVPAHLRKFTINDSSRFSEYLPMSLFYQFYGPYWSNVIFFLYHFFLTVKKGDEGVDIIVSLCKMYETSEDELRKTMEKTNKLIESILKKKPCLASECKVENLDNISTGTKFHHDWLLV